MFGWGMCCHLLLSYYCHGIPSLAKGVNPLTQPFADESQQSYDQYQNQDTASLGHEVLAGGAGFAAMKAFEDRQRKEGARRYRLLSVRV